MSRKDKDMRILGTDRSQMKNTPEGRGTTLPVGQGAHRVTPCFTPGTLIATPRGEMPAELLKVGDKVVTRDNGIQPIRWVGHNDMNWRNLQTHAHLKPVLVREGSLGDGLPERDMMVSPNHRILVSNALTALHFEEPEVLVAAKHLVGGLGMQTIDSFGTTYIHFLFDRHEILLSNGCWSESFQPQDYSLKGLGNAQRNEIYELFPELKDMKANEKFGPARRILSRVEARIFAK
jgi:Hint domain